MPYSGFKPEILAIEEIKIICLRQGNDCYYKYNINREFITASAPNEADALSYFGLISERRSICFGQLGPFLSKPVGCISYDFVLFDVEYIYGFVGWGVCKQSR